MGKIIVGITGTTGFIGKNLVKYLEREYNQEITIIKITSNLLSLQEIEKELENKQNIQVIIHLVGKFFGNFQQLLDINLVATKNLVEAMIKNNIKNIIYTSTGGVYGEPYKTLSKEKDELKPNTEYGLIKMFTEEYIKYMAKEKEIKYQILRFPAVYGPDNNKGVIYNFIKDIKEKQKITIYGDGTQSRNFLHVQDACLGIIKTVFYTIEKDTTSNIFNISNPQKTSLKDLITQLQKKYKFDIEYKEANNNLKNLLLNTKKAKSILNYKAEKVKIRIL